MTLISSIFLFEYSIFLFGTSLFNFDVNIKSPLISFSPLFGPILAFVLIELLSQYRSTLNPPLIAKYP